jgi:hypothetical protein
MGMEMDMDMEIDMDVGFVVIAIVWHSRWSGGVVLRQPVLTLNADPIRPRGQPPYAQTTLTCTLLAQEVPRFYKYLLSLVMPVYPRQPAISISIVSHTRYFHLLNHHTFISLSKCPHTAA